MSCRMQRWTRIGQISVLILCANSNAFAAVKITSIDFKGVSDPSEISIQADGPLTYDKQENAQDKQIVLEFKNATISGSNTRKIDTSSFNSKVSLISPYQVEGQPDTVRVVVQLREFVAADVTQEGNLIKVKVPNSSSSAATNSDSKSSESNSDPNPESSPRSTLDQFVEDRVQQKFTGKPITLQVKDADVEDVLRLIGDASGFNIIMGSDVKGKLSLSLIDVPWDQALDVILHTLHLGAERTKNILRVETLRNLANEKQEEFNVTQAAQLNTPKVTRVFPINYAAIGDLQGILTQFLNPPAQSSGGRSTAPTVATIPIQIDQRTNSIIVRDSMDNIERAKKLIEILDTQTPQVIIEAKIIEATEGFSKSLSGNLGISNGDSSAVASFAGGNPLDPLVGSPGIFADGSAVSSQSKPSSGTPQGTFGISPLLSFLPGLGRLTALLNWGESENQLKVISSPKTVVMNKQRATIIQGTPVLVPGTTTVAGVGTVPTTSVQQAQISMNVVPTVTNEGSVLLNLTVTKDIPISLASGQGIGNRSMTTQVLVESGTTLVIGGIYTLDTTHSSAGFPILRKLPIIGALFGSESDSTSRSELFFFITPRILNSKEAGLTNG